MNFEKYILKNDGFFIKFFTNKLVKTTIEKVFFYFYVTFSGRHFLSRRFDVVKLDKIPDPEMNFRIFY